MWYTNTNSHEVYFSNPHGATIRLDPGQRVQMGKSFIEAALKANVLVEPDSVDPSTRTKSEAEIRAEVEAKIRAEVEASLIEKMARNAPVVTDPALTEPAPDEKEMLPEAPPIATPANSRRARH